MYKSILLKIIHTVEMYEKKNEINLKNRELISQATLEPRKLMEKELKIN